MPRLSRRTALALPLAALPGLASAQSQAWPTRPIRIVVPFGTGGGTDITTRVLAPKLSEILGQPVVIENRPGAGGTLGADVVAKAPPNGETFLLATVSNMALAIGLYSRLPYDPLKDFSSIAPTVFIPIGMAISSKLGVSTAQEFIALLKANPGKYSYGSAGAGTSGHIASSAFLSRIGATAEHIPYRNPGQTYLALQQGEIAFTSDIPSILAPFHQAGTARLIFVATDERSPVVPEVPTAREVGLGDYKAYSWYGIYAPAGTPAPIVTRMAAAIEQALSDPTIGRRFDEMGTPAMRGWTPQRFEDFLKSEIDLWLPLVRASGARAD
ncbi:Bug family tripartite tricarboxylate transporter substrate binding protein [Falsiroseomonas tokyonensis]|uniref:Bug family tripartite tricarboxylate transporter substrate binding protein n=1 Tax=Falsiroseomonas tokyonensis TaxID=430521 RepID=A0ABV7BV41_9PROT|nr:tripartite tricarboxylate transporter substrate binding protein [Falsiroseomonas tokyonensis]MBU8537860.1 tripartite tricarboxylate transporter substrate binding protein [Falsiroseomonas tokyonensis]